MSVLLVPGYGGVAPIAGSGTFEARRDSDGLPVVARVHRIDDALTVARAELELEPLFELELAGLMRPLALERVDGQLVVVYERAPGVGLDRLSETGSVDVEQFLVIASGLLTILAELHERGRVHGDLRPATLWFDASTQRSFLGPCAAPTLLEREHAALDERTRLVAVAPYLAPECDASRGRVVDPRSDLYALGASLFLLLSRRPPFAGDSCFGLRHARLTRVPRLEPGVPRTLAAMLARLLGKRPRERYRSASGVLADVRRFADAWASGNQTPEFELGADDRPTALSLGVELRGREPQLRRLGRELAAVRESGCARVVVVQGPAGAGKRSLLEGVEDTILAREGCYGIGRCEPGGAPFDGLCAALDGVAQQLEQRGPRARARWREHLEAQLGGHTAVIVELIPRLGSLLGEPEPAPRLEPDAARRRTELALFRLLGALGRRAALALALDEIDGAGADDLELLEALILAGPPVLLVLAGSELGPAVSRMLERLSGGGTAVSRVELEPLGRKELGEYTGDLLASSPAELPALPELVAAIERRCDCLAGTVQRCLIAMSEGGVLGPSSIGWSWDLDAAETASFELDSAAWLASRLAKAAPGDAAVLERAACLGQRFDAAGLARVCALEPRELARALARLVQARVLIERGADYEFAWGLRAASLARLDPATRSAHELGLAEALARSDAASSPSTLSSLIAARVVRAGGREALAALAPARRETLASHCAAAGRLALERGAWTWASEVLAIARSVLDADAAAPSIALDHAVASTFSGQREAAEAVFLALLERPLPVTTYAELAACRIRCMTWQARAAQAIEFGAVALARFGVHLSRKPGRVTLVAALARSYLACRNLELDELLARGPVDPDTAAMLVIADALSVPAFFVNSDLFVLLAALRVERVARGGLHPAAPAALAQFATAVATGLRRPEQAARLCDLAVDLCDHVDNGEAARALVESSALLVVWPLSRPIGSSVDMLIDCQRRAIENADVGLARALATFGVGLGFHAGVQLGELLALGRDWESELARWSAADERSDVAAWLEVITALVDPQAELAALLADEWRPSTGANALLLNGALALWLLGEREAAAARIESLADPLERRMWGSWQVPPGAVMLAIVANHRREAGALDARAAIERIRRALTLARRFARSSWANFGAHAELIRAELERARGRTARAVDAYERARELAMDGNNPCMQALAGARLAMLALATGRRATARGAASTAISALRRWGAEAGARRLELEHAQLLAVAVPSTRSLANGVTARASLATPSEARELAVDVSTVLGVMQLISEAIALEQVIARVIASAVSSAGNERAALLLDNAGIVGLVAEGDRVEVDEFCDEPVPIAAAGDRVPRTIVEHTLETGATVVIDDARTDLRFAGDPYLHSSELRSLLCMPITRTNEQVGVLLVENRVSAGAFPSERIELLRILLTQAASALGHARLYEALQRSEVLFRSLVDGVPDMISLMDRSGRIEFINHLDQFDVDPATLVGVDSTLIMDPSCGPQWRAALEHVAETGEQRELEICVNYPGGVSCWYQIRLAGLAYGGKIGKLISIATDITARKRAEADKLRLEAQLRQQQRLESVGTLASGVAHEINNPIQGIMNYADLILSRAGDRELVVDFACEILTESERVATIVRNLLAFSRQEAEQVPEPANVKRLIEATLSLIRAVIRKDDIDLRIDLPDDLDEVRCRFQQIQQVIMNLVANARDALNERFREPSVDKVIEIRARRFERDGRRWVRISVEDYGAGIPDQVRARIFDPFFSTKTRDQGTGLGLAVSHGIAVEHGGELWVESELGAGSTFHLELPAIIEP